MDAVNALLNLHVLLATGSQEAEPANDNDKTKGRQDLSEDEEFSFPRGFL